MLDDDAFLFDVGVDEIGANKEDASTLRSTFGSSFKKTSVGRNTETGEIQGWQEFYELVCLDSPDLRRSIVEQQ